MKQYLDAVRKVLEKGTRKESRTGVDTISRFNINYEIDLREGFPLLTTKEINWKNIVAEVMWFLSGDPDVSLLRKHGCHFWDPWADAEGKVPSAYGNLWRRFPVHDRYAANLVQSETVYAECIGFNDQVDWAVEELKKNPMSRRVVISAWAPGNAQTSKLPPCHITWVLNVQNMPALTSQKVRYFSCETEPRLCLHLTQRSCDIALGVPYNIATYALLQHLISKWTGIPVGIFAHTLVDAHVYTCKPDGSMAEFDHVPGLREQLTRTPRELPQISIKGVWDLVDVDELLSLSTEDLMGHFELQNYNPHPAIKFRVAV